MTATCYATGNAINSDVINTSSKTTKQATNQYNKTCNKLEKFKSQFDSPVECLWYVIDNNVSIQLLQIFRMLVFTGRARLRPGGPGGYFFRGALIFFKICKYRGVAKPKF